MVKSNLQKILGRNNPALISSNLIIYIYKKNIKKLNPRPNYYIYINTNIYIYNFSNKKIKTPKHRQPIFLYITRTIKRNNSISFLFNSIKVRNLNSPLY